MSLVKNKVLVLSLTVVVIVGLLLGACAAPSPTQTPQPTSGPTAEKPVVLKFAHLLGSEGFYSDIYKWWAAELEQRSGGRVKVQFFWSNSLLNLTESLPGTGAGVADLGIAAGTYFPAQMPLALSIENPYNVGDAWVALKAQQELNQINPDVKAELDRANVVYGIPWNSGPFHFFAGWQVNSIDEVKGKVIRTFGGGRQAMWAGLGANGVFMTMTDIYEAMQRGVIDGFENTLILADQAKQGEVTKTLMLTYSGQVASSNFVMNKSTFNSLPADIQQIILQLQNDFIDYAGERLVKEEQGVIDKWKSQGIRVITISDADRAKMKESADKVTLEILKKQDETLGTPGKSKFVWDQYQNLVRKYNTIVKEQGYPWGR